MAEGRTKMICIKSIRFIFVTLLAVIVFGSISVNAGGPVPPRAGIGAEHQARPEEVSPVKSATSSLTMPVVDGAKVIPSSIVHSNVQGFQNEAVVVTNPCNASNIVTSMNYSTKEYEGYPDSRDFDAMVSVSMDKGVSWQTILIPGFPADSQDLSQGDPVLAFTSPPVCRLIYSAISFHHKIYRSSGGGYAVTSDDGGINWNTPIRLDVNTESIFIDKPWIDTSPTSQRTAVCWGRVENGWAIFCRQSNDGGLVWGEMYQLSVPKLYNVGIYPYFGKDGTLYYSLFSFDDGGTDVLFIREDGLQRTVVQQGNRIYQTGMMPSLTEDSNNVINYSWGDGTNVWLTSSNDKGDSWSSPQVIASGPNGSRFMKPFNCTDPLGQVLFGAHLYDSNSMTLQLHIGVIGGEGLFPAGPRYPVVGDINDWSTHRQHTGDYNGCSSNMDTIKPGIVTAFTTATPSQSIPSGYIGGSNNNVEAAIVTTVPWAVASQPTKLWRPSLGTLVTETIKVFNDGIVSGQFQILVGDPVNCPSLSTPDQILISARGDADLLVSADLDGFEVEDRWCQYQVSITGYTSRSETKTLLLWLGKPIKAYLPGVFR